MLTTIQEFMDRTDDNKKRVFLGGTCANSDWRQRLIPMLDIDYFDPVVDDWTEEAQREEVRQRESCDICLYVITPRMEGVYSIAEVVDDSNKRPEKTVFCVLSGDVDDSGEDLAFTEKQLKSLKQVGKMVTGNGGLYFEDLTELAGKLNSM